MLAYISGLVLKLFGWKVKGDFPEGNKFVVLAAPHTSMWDFVWGKFYYWSIRKPVKFMIKEKYFTFPLGILLKSLGAIPVVMSRKTGLVKQMVSKYKNDEVFMLTITPEATRSKVKRWKRGFYHIAKESQVPVALGYLDFEKKELGILETITPTDDELKDMEYIRQKYENVKAKYPENYNAESIV